MTAQDNSGAIPADVMEAAMSALQADTYRQDLAYLRARVAHAILAERERAAKKADHFAAARNARKARELTTHEVYEVKIFARLIAAAIRKGDA